MSVYQIEQYYVHMSIKGFSVQLKDSIKELLGDHSCSDYEFQEDYLIVDGFESEHDADIIEEFIHDLVLTNA